MRENPRRFEVTDPFGRVWDVEFRWLQNAISIRHADAVDCKYYLSCEGEERRELVVALPHAPLVELARERGRELTDAWCLHLASLHVEQMISNWEDMEHTIVTLPAEQLARHNETVEKALAEMRRAARLTH